MEDESTNNILAGGAGGAGVLAVVLGITLIATIDRLSRGWLITLILLLTMLILAVVGLIVAAAYQLDLTGHGCGLQSNFYDGCNWLLAAFPIAGLAMMLNIRLCYSTAPYALIRFRLPENLFSVFVRRMASSLEIWCLPAFVIADLLEHIPSAIISISISINNDQTDNNGYGYEWKASGGKSEWDDTYHGTNPESKKFKYRFIIWPSVIAQWLNFLTYVILLVSLCARRQRSSNNVLLGHCSFWICLWSQ